MKARLLGAVSAFTLAVLSTAVNASLLVPARLSPGDAHHVIFMSLTSRNALSSDIADHDAHEQAAADAAGIGAGIGLSWSAVGSTDTVSAYDHLAPLFSPTTNVPIYSQKGDLVSESFDGLWDDLLSSSVKHTGTGTLAFTSVWTGTTSQGQIELATVGGTSLQQTVPNQFFDLPLYGMSEQLVVPVPAAAWLFGTGLIGLVGVGRRKKAA